MGKGTHHPSFLGKTGLFTHPFIFLFHEIQLLFRKDLGHCGEIRGLRVLERNIDAYSHSLHGGHWL